GFFGDVVTGPHKVLGHDSMMNPCTPPAMDCAPATEHVNVEVPAVPIFDRLYLGGSNNLRGFRFRDIGPRDSNGQPIGGQSMVRATAELTFPIIEKARGAIFYDCGFVNPDAWDFGPETIDVPRGNNAIATILHNRFGVPFGNSGGMGHPPPAPISLVSMVSPRRTFDTFASDFGIG